MPIQRTAPAAFSVASLNSLATSATVGAQSAQVVSGLTSNVIDITVGVDIALPAVTGTASTRVDVYVWGTNDDAGFPGGSVTNEVITGNAGAITISSIGTNSLDFLGTVTQNLSATPQTVRLERSVVATLGFVPRRWGLAFINNTGAMLPASGHTAEYTETSYN